MGLIVTVFWKAIGKVKVVNVRVVVSVERPHHDCVPLKYKKIQKNTKNDTECQVVYTELIVFFVVLSI